MDLGAHRAKPGVWMKVPQEGAERETEGAEVSRWREEEIRGIGEGGWKRSHQQHRQGGVGSGKGVPELGVEARFRGLY